MARFKFTNKSQGMFLSINLKEQLVEGTLEWAIDYLINKIDISIFEKNYNNDEKGAAAYSPKVLLKIVLFCYSRGILSSRKMETACKENIVTKALADDSEPDHATIASFISSNPEAVIDLFTQVVLKCGELGLIAGEMFAGDGRKISSNASKEWSGKLKDLKKKRDKLEKYIASLLQEHSRLDKDEDAKKKLEPFRKTMGDDKERRERSIERLEKKLEKISGFLEDAKPRIGLSTEEVKSNITDNESAFIKSPHGYIQGYNGVTISDSANQIVVAAEAIGSGSESGSLPKMLDSLEGNMQKATGKKNPLKNSLFEADTGFFTEENLQEAKKRKINVLIPDPQFRQRDSHFGGREDHGKKKKKFIADDFIYDKKLDQFKCPSGSVLEYKGEVPLRNNTGKKYKAKSNACGICPLIEQCITIRKEKPPKDGKKKRKKSAPSRALYIPNNKYKENLSEQMKDKIDDPVNRELYSRRMQIIEPVFSNITYCKGMNRFTLRTQRKVDIQWKLYCIVHNIGKFASAIRKKLSA